MINIAFLLPVDDVADSFKCHGYSFYKISKPTLHFPFKRDIILHFYKLAFIVLIDVNVNNFNSYCEAPITRCWYINR